MYIHCFVDVLYSICMQRLIFETLGWDDFKIIFKYDLKVKGFVHQNWGIMPLS